MFYLQHNRYKLEELKDTFSINELQAACLSTHIVSRGQVLLPTFFKTNEEDAFKNYMYIVEDVSGRVQSPDGMKLICNLYLKKTNQSGTNNPVSRENVKSVRLKLSGGRKSGFTMTMDIDSWNTSTSQNLSCPFFEDAEVNWGGPDNINFKSRNAKSGNYLKFQSIVSDFTEEEIKSINDACHFRVLPVRTEVNIDKIDDINDYYTALDYNALKSVSRWTNLPIFRWPSLNFEIIENNPHLFKNDLELLEQGLLGSLGYHVGRQGRGVNARREILSTAIEMPLEEIKRMGFREEYWGNARDPSRLKAMVFAIFSFINCRKNSPAMNNAVSDWASDLDWLRENYYNLYATQPFAWPSMEKS
jgi:hypothetical protein